MKRLGACLAVLGLMAWGAAAAESRTDADEAALVELVRAASLGSTERTGSLSRTDVQERMRDDGIPAHWVRPSAPLRVRSPGRDEPAPDPFARPTLFDDVRFRSDGSLADQIARDYDGFGRDLSRTLLGDKRGEQVRFKRVDDGVGISIDFD